MCPERRLAGTGVCSTFAYAAFTPCGENSLLMNSLRYVSAISFTRAVVSRRDGVAKNVTWPQSHTSASVFWRTRPPHRTHRGTTAWWGSWMILCTPSSSPSTSRRLRCANRSSYSHSACWMASQNAVGRQWAGLCAASVRRNTFKPDGRSCWMSAPNSTGTMGSFSPNTSVTCCFNPRITPTAGRVHTLRFHCGYLMKREQARSPAPGSRFDAAASW